MFDGNSELWRMSSHTYAVFAWVDNFSNFGNNMSTCFSGFFVFPYEFTTLFSNDTTCFPSKTGQFIPQKLSSVPRQTTLIYWKIRRGKKKVNGLGKAWQQFEVFSDEGQYEFRIWVIKRIWCPSWPGWAFACELKLLRHWITTWKY